MLSLRKATLAAAAVALSIAPAAFAQMNLPRLSPKSTVKQTIGTTDVTIVYSRPGVKGRVIWGALVPWDQVWRTGANEATTFEVTDEVTINGQKLAAGKYSLHTIPSRDHWTLIFNKVSDQWGSFSYDQKQDALRVDVKPQQAEMAEWMMFSFPELTPNSATAELRWEKVRIPFTIQTDVMGKGLKSAREAVAKMDDWRTPYNAATFAFTNGLDNKEEQGKWIDRSIASKETFWNLRLKAQMLAAQGKSKEAIALGERALKVGRDNKEEESEVTQFDQTVASWKAKK